MLSAEIDCLAECLRAARRADGSLWIPPGAGAALNQWLAHILRSARALEEAIERRPGEGEAAGKVAPFPFAGHRRLSDVAGGGDGPPAAA